MKAIFRQIGTSVKAKPMRVPSFMKERTDPAKSRYRYLIDERSILTEYPVRIFNLEGLGFTIDEANQFINIFKSDEGMQPDNYAMKVKQVEYLMKTFPEQRNRLRDFLYRYYPSNGVSIDEVKDIVQKLPYGNLQEFNLISSTRTRSISRFILTKTVGSNLWDIKEKEIKAYSQNVESNDYRSLPRIFSKTSTEKTSNPLFAKFLSAIANLVEEREGLQSIENLEMDLHEVRVLTPGSPSPEGPHQDGVPYVVTAFNIERASINGGESIVFDGSTDEKDICLKTILKPGEGSFHVDSGSTIFHHATPIFPDQSNNEERISSRKTLGLDIRVRRKPISLTLII